MIKTKLTMILPKVGDRLERVLSTANLDVDAVYEPEPCVVTYVNDAHGWYEVEFINSGLRECYNYPVFDHSILKGASYGGIPVLCVETGEVYPAINACASDMNIDRTNLSRHARGVSGWSTCGGYHFITVL